LGENTTAITIPKWPLSILRAAPVAKSQSLTILSVDTDTTRLLSGENATAATTPKWPLSMLRAAPVAES
jgi:hypothetical protein